MKNENTRHKLHFTYCECGCKCFTAGRYHVYWDLEDNWTLFEGRFRDSMKIFSTFRGAVQEAQARFDSRG